MRIAEIFYSIQGEGELTGVPSVFVRTSGCNLRCVWCDTPYASWNPEGRDVPVDEVLQRILEFAPARHVVLTGGEPLLAGDLPELSQKLRALRWHVTVETAGTLSPGALDYDLASLSPKLSGSTPSQEQAGSGWSLRHEQNRINLPVLREWLSRGRFQLKFVVGGRAEFEEVSVLLRELAVEIPPHKVLLMPEGIESEGLRARSLEVAQWCKESGFRFCDRLHVHLYGHTRGT
jgi:7-carboxy-7-deazaguanine synthase